MKNSELRDLTTDEIRVRISEEKESLQKMKMSHAVSPIDNPLKMRSTRKLIARLKTEFNQRQKSTVKA
ncbi:MAG TPA: 50S ribosomal protein L29 [Bacteroidia bacterium]|nr:50S ribosomal protein L29 [Bacteroidia bacterium]HNU34148.1 50S ribosomal protein L29 [Bacteroidia bacterium]